MFAILLISASRLIFRLKTVSAKDRLIVGRPERNHGFFAAASANRGEHFAFRIAASAAATAASLLVLPRSPAFGATLGLVCKTFFCVEVLFTLCEHEICPAIPASKCFVSQLKSTSIIHRSLLPSSISIPQFSNIYTTKFSCIMRKFSGMAKKCGHTMSNQATALQTSAHILSHADQKREYTEKSRLQAEKCE